MYIIYIICTINIIYIYNKIIIFIIYYISYTFLHYVYNNASYKGKIKAKTKIKVFLSIYYLKEIRIYFFF